MSETTYKITSLANVPFAGSCKLVDDSLKTNSNQTITFPSNGGTLATSEDLNVLNTKMNNLLDYLEHWIDAGNLSMADIKTAVNGAESP